MSVPTFDQMRKCMAPIWQNEDYQTDILWAGVFGSVARNRAHEDDVDILIVLKEHERSGEPIDLRENLAEACGREISLMCIWQGPDWAWGHVRLEALLSSRSVYGNRRDVEHLRREAMAYLNDGLKRLDLIAEAVKKIKNQVTSVQTYEDFIHPAQQAACQECVQELRKVVKLLDIHPLYHPIRTMLISLSFEYADQIRALLDQDPPDINGGAAPVWRTIWDHLQPTSATMWAFDAGCAVGGRNYIRHILASKRLADRFEEGGQVDDSMYREIIR
ncbi:putative nucleotidyltransferase domain containing protein [Lyophyllum shimeji]|uniref:Nucleotidyltransferase domain containing protein n=1 Tax=Lyophyllum shimeji TaxID=47721 RepID=A0A9P3Q2E9_LYOSH|nr:putative nucleotidyltransferase domain containing protein [Lyophyllum shimeji]